MAKKGKIRKPICFVIAPIDDEGTSTRDRSDKVLKHIIAPAARRCGYRTVRADQLPEPGIITSQVIEHLASDPLVIADLTDRNPNVFYELALRHASGRPVVQLIQVGQSLPFDISQMRTIDIDHQDLDRLAKSRKEIVSHIRTLEKDPTQFNTPVSNAFNMQRLRESDDPMGKTAAEMMSLLQEIKSAVIERPRSRLQRVIESQPLMPSPAETLGVVPLRPMAGIAAIRKAHREKDRDLSVKHPDVKTLAELMESEGAPDSDSDSGDAPLA